MSVKRMRAYPSKGFGDRLTYLRKRRVMYQGDAAHQCDINQQQWSTYECEFKSPSLGVLERIIDGLDLSGDELKWLLVGR